MNGINKVILIGHLGADPEIRYTRAGGAVASFRIATTEKWKDRESGEQREKTEWHNITIFGKLAEVVEQYVHKGDPVYLEGKLTTEKWQDRDGNDRYTTKVIAHEMQMLGSKNRGEGRSEGRSEQRNERPREQPQQKAVDFEEPGFDDDIPF